MREYSLSEMVLYRDERLIPICREITRMVIPTAVSINRVCSRSVQMMVLIPPLKVYNQINRIVMTTVAQKGTFHASKILICNTLDTRNKRKAVPIALDSRKKDAPVL
jgi:hypothetical protein